MHWKENGEHSSHELGQLPVLRSEELPLAATKPSCPGNSAIDQLCAMERKGYQSVAYDVFGGPKKRVSFCKFWELKIIFKTISTCLHYKIIIFIMGKLERVHNTSQFIFPSHYPVLPLLDGLSL